MESLDALLDRLEELIGEVDDLPDETRTTVLELLDGVDSLHRHALHALVAGVSERTEGDPVGDTRRADPAANWICEAYGIGVNERAAAEAALDTIRPYIDSHGGHVEILDVTDGRVGLRMSGSCSGCTASTVTLTHGITEALREHLPGFVAVEVEEDDAEPHPPPGETLLEIGRPPNPP